AFCLWSGRRPPFMHLPRPPPLAHELATSIRCDGCVVVRGEGTLLPCRECLHLARPINERLNPSRTQRTDPAQAQCIWPSIVNSCAQDNAPSSVCPAHHSQAYTLWNAAACADEPETEASPLCRYVGSSARTTLVLLACLPQ